jgi:hypothetical protein
VAPDAQLVDPQGRFETTAGIGGEGAVVVRPDGVIAWRSIGGNADADTCLEDVVSRLTFRPGVTSGG